MAAKRRLKGVDTLRAMAAVLVVVGHDIHFVNELPHEQGGGVHVPLFGPGLGACLLLFVAGFMSVYSAWDRFGRDDQSIHYLKRRFSRLVPMYWLFTTFWLVVALAAPALVSHAAPKPGHIVTSYLFIPYRREDGGIFPILALGWTMNYIFLFDLVTAFSMRFDRRRAVWVILAICAVLLALHPLVTGFVPAYFWTGRYVLLYAAGALASYIYKNELLWLDRIRLPPAIGFVMLVGLAIVAGFYLQGPTTLEITSDFAHLFPIVTIMALIAIATHETGGTGVIATIRDKLAQSSFSIYLTHPFSLGIFIVVWKKLGLYRLLPGDALLVAALIGSLIVGYIVNLLIETRLNRTVDSLMFPRGKPAPAPAGTPVSDA